MTLHDANDTDGRRTVPAGTLVVALVALLLTAAPAAAGVAGAATAGVADEAATAEVSSQAAPAPSFVVDLATDGSARVTVTLTYDLATDDERAAFRTLQNDSDARTDTRDRFASRMSSVAADASAATGREMGVTDPAIELSTTDGGNVGVVELSVTWTGMAARTDGELVVTEPFASGFQPDQQFVLGGLRATNSRPPSRRRTARRPATPPGAPGLTSRGSRPGSCRPAMATQAPVPATAVASAHPGSGPSSPSSHWRPPSRSSAGVPVGEPTTPSPRRRRPAGSVCHPGQL